MVGPRLQGARVDEYRRPSPPAFTLQRQGDEVPERLARGQIVLRREQAVIGGQVQFDAKRHRLSQQCRPQRPGRCRGDGGLEERPDMCAVARPGTFERGRYPGRLAYVPIGSGVELPTGAVEVAGQQPARVAAHQGVEANGDQTSQVLDQDGVGQGQQVPDVAPMPPAVLRRRPPTFPSRLLVLPAQGVHVVTADEQAPVEPHFCFPGRPVRHLRNGVGRPAGLEQSREDSRDRRGLDRRRRGCLQLGDPSLHPLDLVAKSHDLSPPGVDFSSLALRVDHPTML